MQKYPVREFDPAKRGDRDELTLVWHGFTIVTTVDSASLFELGSRKEILDLAGLPVMHLTEIFLRVERYEEVANIFVTRIEDLIPLHEKILVETQWDSDIVMSSNGFKDMLKYNPADPTTNPGLCKDCGT